jgi:hypothetical protein
LRRRAAALVKQLLDAYRARLACEDAAALEHAAKASAAAHSAARIEGDADAIAGRLATFLLPHARAWAQDLELVFVGRDPQRALVDPVLAHYRVDRALAALTPALSAALASLAPEGGLSPAQLSPSARAIVRTAVSCASLDLDDMLSALAYAAVATLAELLLALGGTRRSLTRTAGTLRELEAFARALQ